MLCGILTALGPGPVLLVPDNCEQVVDGVADLVGAPRRGARREAARTRSPPAGHPWMWVPAHARIVELLMLAGQGARALAHIGEVEPMLRELGAAQAVQIPWVTALAHLQCDEPDDAEPALKDALPDIDGMDTATASFDLAVRAEVVLARGEPAAGLELWRRAVARVHDTGGLDDDLPGPDP